MSEFGGVVQPEQWDDDDLDAVWANAPKLDDDEPIRRPPAGPVSLPTLGEVEALDQIAAVILEGQTDMLVQIERIVEATGRLRDRGVALTGVPGPAIDDVNGSSELDVTPEDPTP